MPGLPWDPITRAASLCRLGRMADSKLLIDELLQSNPEFPKVARIYIDKYVFEPELAGKIYDALLEAGLPKG